MICIHTYLPTYLPTYLLTYLPTYLPTYIHTYIYIYNPNTVILFYDLVYGNNTMMNWYVRFIHVKKTCLDICAYLNSNIQTIYMYKYIYIDIFIYIFLNHPHWFALITLCSSIPNPCYIAAAFLPTGLMVEPWELHGMTLSAFQASEVKCLTCYHKLQKIHTHTFI